MARRLLLVVALSAIFSLALSVLSSGRIPTGQQMMGILPALLFLCVLFAVVVPILYWLSCLISRTGIAAWIVFPILLILLNAGWSYHSMIGYEFYQSGREMLVVAHKVTLAGWRYWWQDNASETLIAIFADIVLFSGRAKGFNPGP